MSEFKATVRNANNATAMGEENYTTPEGIIFLKGKEYECHIKQNPVQNPEEEDIPTFVEITGSYPSNAKIGMLLEEALEHFHLYGKCEHCGTWFEIDYPAFLCRKCFGMLNQGLSETIEKQFSAPENYKRLKDRFKD